jgi:hypothetical protein
MQIPNPDYLTPSSFGSLELRQRAGNEFIGQTINYTDNTTAVSKIPLDDLNLPRVDFIKLDIEGMEMEALDGARKTIKRNHPILLIERIKTDAVQLERWLASKDYTILPAGINVLAIHASDKALETLDLTSKRQQAKA